MRERKWMFFRLITRLIGQKNRSFALPVTLYSQRGQCECSEHSSSGCSVDQSGMRRWGHPPRPRPTRRPGPNPPAFVTHGVVGSSYLTAFFIISYQYSIILFFNFYSKFTRYRSLTTFISQFFTCPLSSNSFCFTLSVFTLSTLNPWV